MPLTDYRLISFACFGTLIDRDSGVYAALRPLAARLPQPLAREAVIDAFDQHEQASIEALPGARYSDILLDTHQRLASAWHLRASNGDAEVFADSVSHWPVYADAAGALQYLMRYVSVALLSNADGPTLETISRRLEVRFDVMLSAAETGGVQPRGRSFDALYKRARKLGISPAQMLHVAASLPHDPATVSDLGTSWAWIDRRGRGGARGVEYGFTSLAELVRAHQSDLRG